MLRLQSIPKLIMLKVKVKSDEKTLILAKNAIGHLGDDKVEVLRAFKGSSLRLSL